MSGAAVVVGGSLLPFINFVDGGVVGNVVTMSIHDGNIRICFSNQLSDIIPSFHISYDDTHDVDDDGGVGVVTLPPITPCDDEVDEPGCCGDCCRSFAIQILL